MLPSFRNQSQWICLRCGKRFYHAPQANQLTGFYMTATLTFNGLSAPKLMALTSHSNDKKFNTNENRELKQEVD